MTQTHTQGPWHVGTNGQQQMGVFSAGGTEIAACPIVAIAGGMGNSVHANARLIAAAPELLEAALAVQASYTKDALTMAHAIKQLNAAIAEARGQA